jgi:hypothetical protein
MLRRARLIPLIGASAGLLFAASQKLTPDQRIELIRGLTAEYATVRVELPRSPKPLGVDTGGAYDKKAWQAAGSQFGPAARVGDLVRLTSVAIEDDRLVLQINGGFNSGKKKWYQRIEVGVGSQTMPVSKADQSNAAVGTAIALLFHGPVPPLRADQIKKMLAPILDFEQRSVAETYLESLPPEIQQAVKERRAIEGMDRDQVILALGLPVRKIRETKDGVELEDWIYGAPPGKITFVTFDGNKVVKVKEAYAGLGTQAPRLESPR